MLLAIYPGTFDPLTRGHEDLVRRASKLCDRLVVAIAAGHHKNAMFTLDERLDIAREVLSPYPNVEVSGFTGCCAISSWRAAPRWWCAGCARSATLSTNSRWPA